MGNLPKMGTKKHNKEIQSQCKGRGKTTGKREGHLKGTKKELESVKTDVFSERNGPDEKNAKTELSHGSEGMRSDAKGGGGGSS